MDNNLHKNHRQRARNEFYKIGLDNMDDYKILEILLFYGIPYKDTNETAHKLIDTFHNLNGVLEAPVEELTKIDGIGDNTATLIKLVRDIARKYNYNKMADNSDANTLDNVEDFLEMKFIGETRENVYIVSYDSQGRLDRCIKLNDGSFDTVALDIKRIARVVLLNDMTNIVIAHNHPNGFAVPSNPDVKATEEIIAMMKAIGINVIDHIIFSADSSFSMAKSKKYGLLFR